MARARKKKPAPRTEWIGPTPEREQHGEFVSAGPARLLMPVIDRLWDRGTLTDAEYSALAYYRDQAGLADRSPVRSCCDNSPRGGDGGPGVAILSAMLETGRIERDLGELRDLAFAVAVEDKTLEQWCIAKYGGRERYNGSGDFIAIVPVCERRHVAMARMELKMAARRIVR